MAPTLRWINKLERANIYVISKTKDVQRTTFGENEENSAEVAEHLDTVLKIFSRLTEAKSDLLPGL